MAAVDPLEAVALGPAMGECGEDENSRHEAQGAGCEGVLGREAPDVLRGSKVGHQPQHPTTRR